MINDLYYRRRYAISGIAIGVVLVFIIRLFYLQVIDQSTKDQADNNALVKQTIYPSRGLIYDRNGELLWEDKGSGDYRLVVDGDDISTYMRQATVAIEDKNFYKHNGFDYPRIIKAFFKNISKKKVI